MGILSGKTTGDPSSGISTLTTGQVLAFGWLPGSGDGPICFSTSRGQRLRKKVP